MNSSVDLKTGQIVNLLDSSKSLVLDQDKTPMIYQVTSVYREAKRVGLVTSYGEYVGFHPIDNVVYLSEGPLFKKEDHTVGETVVWLDHEDVYEGVIDTLLESTAKLKHVKKLLPINHTVRVPYWKIHDGRKSKIAPHESHRKDGDLKLGGEDIMSTKANIVLRNSMKKSKEIFLYQHSEAHPNNLTLILAEKLREIYLEFKELGDVDWFLDPSKLASFLIVKSVPSATEDIKQLMKQLPDSTRYQLESMYFLGMPTMLVENSRVSNCNYEYLVTLKEDVENDFFGYELDVNKLSGNKVVSSVMQHQENLLREKSKHK